MSIVTMSGDRERICSSASIPSAAVPTTRYSPFDSTISAMSWRMNALSSTTSTVESWSLIQDAANEN